LSQFRAELPYDTVIVRAKKHRFAYSFPTTLNINLNGFDYSFATMESSAK
jgi:hypothetical protein